MNQIFAVFYRLWKRGNSLALWQRVALLAVLVTGLQFLVPGDYLPLRTSLDGQDVAVSRRGDLLQQVTSASKQAQLAIGKQALKVNASELGLSTDVNKTLSQVPQLSLVERLVPFGVLLHLSQSPEVTTVRTVDQRQLDQSAQKLASKYSSQPKDATATVVNGTLTLTEEVPGSQVKPTDIKNAVMDSVKQRQRVITVSATQLPAKVKKGDFAAAQTQFKSLDNQSLTVRYGSTTKSYSAQQIKKWLSVKQDTTTGKWALAVSAEGLAEELTAWSKDYNIPAGTTQVTTVDGNETSRRNGAAGRAIDADVTLAKLTAWVNKPQGASIDLATKVLPAKVVVSRFYSASSAGLQAKLDAWVQSHSGSYQVAIVELGGQGRQASYNVSQQTVMASTYKLFVAFAVYQQSEIGALNLGTTLSTSNSANGLTIEKCIEKAIIYSDNDCAIALGKYVGWAKCDQIVAAAGFQNVKLNNYTSSGALSGDKMVNANELAKFLAQLSAGSLMNGNNTGKLLDYMKRQVYRSGIPAGSHGATVADKVGFLEGYLHDAAIVYAPGNTYALVIMSSGSSWSNISNLADAVYSFMTQ